MDYSEGVIDLLFIADVVYKGLGDRIGLYKWYGKYNKQQLPVSRTQRKEVRPIISPQIWRGFRYHGVAHSPYFLPCDDDEQIRLDALQYAVRNIYGKNVLVPLPRKPTLILDVGTGSGSS